MKQPIFIVIPPAIGHFNAVQALAALLNDNNYEVWFLSSPSFKEIVENSGFLFKALEGVPFGMGYETSLSQQSTSFSYIQDLNLRVTDFVFGLRQNAYLEAFTAKQPHIVLVDAILSTDIVAIESLNKKIKVGIVQTMFSTTFDCNLPPLSSLYFPPKDSKKNESLKFWNKLALKKQVQNLWSRIKYFGYSDKKIVESHLTPALQLKDKSYFSVEFENIAELVFAPEELNFVGSSKSNTSYYLGQNINLNRNLSPKTEILNVVESSKQTNQRLIYCSLGTQYDNDEKYNASMFFKTVVSIFETQTDWVVVISANFYPKFQKIYDNVYLCNDAPQLKILQYTDLMIGHGGLNSVKECINYKVPMLLYPLNQDWDQPGNSARVVYHEIGLRGDIKRDTPSQTLEKVTELLSNPKYKTNITAMKNRIAPNLAYKPERILEIIKDLPYLG